MIRWIFFWACIAVWFGSFFFIVTCLCMAAKRGDEMAGRIDAGERNAYLEQPVREALPLEPEERDAEIQRLEAWRAR